MKIYTNKDLAIEVRELDLGIVKAGESKMYTFYLKNDSTAHIKNLKVTVEHDEVEIIEAPSELLANEAKPLIIEWKPSVDLKQGLKTTIFFKGIELYLP